MAEVATQNLVSQRQAAQMLRECGLSRRSAYYRLSKMPSRTLVESRVFSRIDVELACEAIKAGIADS
jgi:hypothetical protein